MLKDRYKVINIDTLGYGEADHVKDKNNYNFSEELERVNKALNILIGEDPFHLVGHSCGGAIALKLAVENANRVLSMSLYEPVAFHLLPNGSDAKCVSDDFASKIDIDDYALAAERFTDFWNKKGFFKSLPEKMQLSMSQDMEKVNIEFIGLTSEKYTLVDMKKITAPVMIMVGEYTPELSKTLSGIIASPFTNVNQKIFPAGHMGPVSHAEIIHPVIAEFIADNS